MHRFIYICSQCLISCISNILMHIKVKNTKSNSCDKGSKLYKHNHDFDRKALTLLFYVSVYSNFGLITVTQSPNRIQWKKGNLQVNASFDKPPLCWTYLIDPISIRQASFSPKKSLSIKRLEDWEWYITTLTLLIAKSKGFRSSHGKCFNEKKIFLKFFAKFFCVSFSF